MCKKRGDVCGCCFCWVTNLRYALNHEVYAVKNCIFLPDVRFRASNNNRASPLCKKLFMKRKGFAGCVTLYQIYVWQRGKQNINYDGHLFFRCNVKCLVRCFHFPILKYSGENTNLRQNFESVTPFIKWQKDV